MSGRAKKGDCNEGKSFGAMLGSLLLKDANVTVEFDKDCLARKLDMKVDISLEGTKVASILSDISYDIHMEMSDYGSVDSDSVVVSENVANAATSQGSNSTVAPSSPVQTRKNPPKRQAKRAQPKDVRVPWRRPSHT